MSPVRHQSPVNFRRVPSGLPAYSRKNTGSGVPSGAIAVHRDVARLAGGHLAAVLVDERDAVPRVGSPHRAGLRRPERVRVADDVVHLGLAEHLVHRDAERLARPLEHGGAERLARAHRAAQPDVEALARPRERLHHQLERRREQEGVAHLIALDQAERALRIEAAAIADDRLAEVQRGQQRVHQAAGPGPVGRRPEHVALLREPVVRVDEARAGCRSGTSAASARPWAGPSCRSCRPGVPDRSASCPRSRGAARRPRRGSRRA